MSLDLGELLGSVDLIITPFEQKYGRVVGMMSRLGAQAEKTEGSVAPLEAGLAGVATSSEAAATGLGGASTALTEAGVSASEASVAIRAAHDVTTEAGLAASKLTQAQLRQAAAAQRVTDAQIAASVATTRLAAAEAALAAASRDGGASDAVMAKAQERVNAAQAAAVAVTGRLAAAEASLIAANDRVALSQDKAARSTGATSQAWQGAAHGMLIAGGLVAAGFLYAAKEAATFDARMALVRTLAKASAADMTQLREAALTAGRAYGFTANQVADAEAELVKAGISVKDIMGGALRGALTLAAAGQEDVAAATETAAIAMTQFKLKGSDVPHIADLLAAGADKALGSVADLSEALKYGGLAASQAGFSIEETVGTLAEFAQAGLMGSSAGTTLQQMLRSLQKPSVDAAGLMKQYGIEVYNSNGQMKSSSQLAGELHNKLGTLPPALRDTALATIFGARAVRGANILMRDGAAANREWIATVNDQGFAALQAAGKMDSLSGDVTKLKSALQVAFIGVGEGSSGPLRTLVQDITSVVNAWNDLPGPVRTAAEALIFATGAVTLLGGAALLFIPKWAAMNAALAETRVGAISAGSALKTLGVAAGVAVAVVGLATALHALHDATTPAAPDLDKMANALVDFGQKGVVSGQLAATFGANLSDLATQAKKLADENSFDKVGNFFAKFEPWAKGTGANEAKKQFDALDSSLSTLVSGGHLDIAQTDFLRISDVLHRAGLSTADITKLFPQFSSALTDSSTSAKAAGTGIDQYGNAATAAAKETQKAADAAKNYSDRLHSLADPLFAMNSALTDLTAKQHAASKAVEKYGADSKQAKQAQEDLASSALDVETSARTLTAAVKDGSVSMSDARKMLRGWVADGLIAKSQAQAIAASWGGLITKAQQLAGSAKKAGHAVGFDFGHGMAIGLSDSTGAVDAQAAKLAMSAAAAARKKHESKSPSKVAMRIGQDFGAGLALGIRSTDGIVASAAADLAGTAARNLRSGGSRSDASGAAGYRHVTSQDRSLDELMRMVTHATNDAQKASQAHAQALSEEASKAHEAAANLRGNTKSAERAKHAAEVHARALDDEARAARQATSALGDQNSGAVKALQHLVTAADQIAAKARSASQGVSSALLGDTGFGALGGQTDSFGNPMPGGGSPGQIIATLSAQRAAVRKMRRQLRREERHGLSYRDEEVIASLGLDTGGGIASTLAGATPRQLREVSRLTAGIGKAAHGVGHDISGGLFGKGIDRLVREQHGSRQLLGEMLTVLRGDTRLDDASIRRLARAIGKQFDPTIITDTPKQDHKQGQRVLAH